MNRLCISKIKEKKHRDYYRRRRLPGWLYELLVIQFDEFVLYNLIFLLKHLIHVLLIQVIQEDSRRKNNRIDLKIILKFTLIELVFLLDCLNFKSANSHSSCRIFI